MNHERAYPNIHAYERPFGSLEVAIWPYKEAGGPKGYTESTEMHGNTHVHYNYDTSI